MTHINASNFVNVPSRSTGDTTRLGYTYNADPRKDEEYLEELKAEVEHFEMREKILELETEIQTQDAFISETDRIVNKGILRSGTCTRMGYKFGSYEQDEEYMEELLAICDHRHTRALIEEYERALTVARHDHGIEYNAYVAGDEGEEVNIPDDDYEDEDDYDEEISEEEEKVSCDRPREHKCIFDGKCKNNVVPTETHNLIRKVEPVATSNLDEIIRMMKTVRNKRNI